MANKNNPTRKADKKRPVAKRNKSAPSPSFDGPTMKLNFPLIGAVELPISKYDKYSKKNKAEIRAIQKELAQKQRQINGLRGLPKRTREIQSLINEEYNSRFYLRGKLERMGLIVDGQTLLPLPKTAATKDEANKRRSVNNRKQWAWAKAIKQNYYADNKTVTLNVIRKDITKFRLGLKTKFDDIVFRNPSPH